MNKQFNQFLKTNNIDSTADAIMDDLVMIVENELPQNDYLLCDNQDVHVVADSEDAKYDYYIVAVNGIDCKFGFCI